MEVGQLTSDRTSFDLDNLEETNSVITRSLTNGTKKVRWLYKDETNRFIVLEKSHQIQSSFNRGALLCLSAVHDGVAEPRHPEEKNDAETVGRLAIDVDFENPGELVQRTVVDASGNAHVCLLCPVILM